MFPDFTTIRYLQTGNTKQQKVFRLLNEHRIFHRLAAFQPVLAGTIPIEIDMPESDLDILCFVPQPTVFEIIACNEFAAFPAFEITGTTADVLPAIICRFMLDEFPVEIFGQNRPATAQNAYRHMIIEHRVLQEKGDAFRQEILALKRSGLKTEPAFARLLGLTGDPYTALLEWGEKFDRVNAAK